MQEGANVATGGVDTEVAAGPRIGVGWAPIGIACALGVIVICRLVAPRTGLLLLALALWFVTPGAVAVGRIYGWRRAGVAWLCAPGWGYVLSSLCLLGCWAGGLQSWRGLVLGPAFAVPLAWVSGGLAAGTVEAPSFTKRDLPWLGASLVLVPLIVGLPYVRVGETTHLGQHFRAYFTADFVWAMAAVAEVSKGAVPPENPFRLATPMHYYWLAHLFPAAEHRWLTRLPLYHLLLVNAVFAGFAFVAWLYGFARHFAARAWAAAAGVAMAVLATSFEALQQIVELWWIKAPIGYYLSVMNIDSVTRWVFKGMPVDGLQRLLFYQPQHQLGYATALSALLLARQARRADSATLGLMVGVALGGSFLISTFSALMVTVAVALYMAFRLVREGVAWRAWRPAVAAAVPLAAAVVLTRRLHYVDLDGGALVKLGLNPLSVSHCFTDFTLGMGPLVIVLVVAVAFWRWRRETMTGTAALWGLAVTSLGFYFFADVRDHQDVYVGWRAGHLLFIGMAGFVACQLEAGRRLPGLVRRAALTLAGLVFVAAVPTVIVDVYNTQDIWNLHETPAGKWTLVLSPDEVAALEWVRTSTPVEATVQVDPIVRGVPYWSYIPTFAERRMAAGIPISMIPLAPYEAASQRVAGIYRAASVWACSELCRRYGIDYLFIGPPERKGHPDFEALVASAPELFAPVFSNGTIAIYHVQGGRH